jgi:hypothetical protein
MKPIFLMTGALIIFVLSGCASVQIYSENNLKSRTGLRIYNSKPFLLVELKSAKDMTVKTSVIYLPDLANPQYLKVKPGIGANELKMAFSNGTLSSYGITASSDIPDIITSLASLISKGSDAAKQIAGLNAQAEQAEIEETFVLYEIVFTTEGVVLKRVGIKE